MGRTSPRPIPLPLALKGWSSLPAAESAPATAIGPVDVADSAAELTAGGDGVCDDADDVATVSIDESVDEAVGQVLRRPSAIPRRQPRQPANPGSIPQGSTVDLPRAPLGQRPERPAGPATEG